MRKVIATALLAGSLAASLAACSQKHDADNGNRQDRNDRQERRAERRGGGGGGDRAGRFGKLDANKDGFLDQSEAPQRMQRRFSRLDSDGDGKISRDEFTSRGR